MAGGRVPMQGGAAAPAPAQEQLTARRSGPGNAALGRADPRARAAMLLRAAGPAGVSARQVARLVKNLDPDDRTATAAAKDLVYRDTRQDTRNAAEHAPLGADLAQPIEERETGTRELRELDHSSEPLYVVGHGNLVRIGDSLEMHADKAANKSP